MRPEYYANEYRKYATFMTDYNNDMMKIASGANSSDYNWTETLMKNIPRNYAWRCCLHHYSVIDWNNKGSATDFTEDQYFHIMKDALFMDTLVTKHSAIMDKYDPQKKVALVVDEWGGWYDVEPGTNPGFLYQQNTMRDAMIAGVTLNIFNNHSDRVRMACLAQCINVLQAVILTNKEKIFSRQLIMLWRCIMYTRMQSCCRFLYKQMIIFLVMKSCPLFPVPHQKIQLGITHISLVNIDSKKTQTIAINIEGQIQQH